MEVAVYEQACSTYADCPLCTLDVDPSAMWLGVGSGRPRDRQPACRILTAFGCARVSSHTHSLGGARLLRFRARPLALAGRTGIERRAGARALHLSRDRRP